MGGVAKVHGLRVYHLWCGQEEDSLRLAASLASSLKPTAASHTSFSQVHRLEAGERCATPPFLFSPGRHMAELLPSSVPHLPVLARNLQPLPMRRCRPRPTGHLGFPLLTFQPPGLRGGQSKQEGSLTASSSSSRAHLQRTPSSLWPCASSLTLGRSHSWWINWFGTPGASEITWPFTRLDGRRLSPQSPWAPSMGCTRPALYPA